MAALVPKPNCPRYTNFGGGKSRTRSHCVRVVDDCKYSVPNGKVVRMREKGGFLVATMFFHLVG